MTVSGLELSEIENTIGRVVNRFCEMKIQGRVLHLGHRI
jgi:hypothetical protein